MTRLRAPLACSVLGAFAILAIAQNAPPQTWVVVTYNRVPPGKMMEYEDAYSGMFAKMAQGRIGAGELLAFVQTRMLLPAGSEAKYNYISANVYDRVPSLDPSREDMDKAWARVGLRRSDFADKMSSIGTVLVNRELWRGIEILGAIQTGDFLRIDRKKVTKPGDYVEQERTYHKAFWAERMKEGALQGWGLYFIALPGGEDRPSSFATIQWFKDEKQMFDRSSVPASESWKVAAPGKDPYVIQQNTQAVSHTATTELGRVRLVVRAPTTSAGGQ